MCEKIVVRNKEYGSGQLISNLAILTAELMSKCRIKSVRLADLKNRWDDQHLMRVIFGEDIDAYDLERSTLYKNYLEATDTGKDNDFFSISIE